MIIYIVAFSASTILFIFGEKVRREQRFIVDIIAIGILCVVAGMRAGNVGTDTGGYLQPTIQAALSKDTIYDYMNTSWIFAGWSHRMVGQYEIGFSLFIWFVTKIFQNVIITQLCLQLLMVFPIYYVCRNRNTGSVWLPMLIYDLMFFNNSLNSIRQSVAISFLLLMFHFWEKNNKRKALVALGIGIIFHMSAIIGIIFILLYEFVKNGKILKKDTIIITDRKVRVMLLVTLGIIGLCIIKYVIMLLETIGIGKYVGYLGNGDAIKLKINQIISRLPGLLIVLCNTKNIDKKNNNSGFFILMIAYSMIAGQLYGDSAVGGALYGGRIAKYFSAFNILSFPDAIEGGKYKKEQYSILICYLAFYWWFYYVFKGTDNTVPYVFFY